MPKEMRLGLKRSAKEWEISLAEHIGKAADKTPDVLMALFQSHPAIMALTVMGLSSLGIIIADYFEEPKLKGHLEGLYGGAQTLGGLVAVVPVIAGALPMITQVISARKEGK